MSNPKIIVLESPVLGEFYRKYESSLLTNPESLIEYMLGHVDLYLNESATSELFFNHIDDIVTSSFECGDDAELAWAGSVVQRMDTDPSLLDVLFKLLMDALKEITQEMIAVRLCIKEDWVLDGGNQQRVLAIPFRTLSSGTILMTLDPAYEEVNNNPEFDEMIVINTQQFALQMVISK